MVDAIRTISVSCLVALTLTGCPGFEPPSGRLVCTSAAECPSGWVCAADMRCYSTAPADAGARDAMAADAMPGDAMPGDVDAGCAADPCDLVDQCGCEEGRGCYPNNMLTASMCAPAGFAEEGEVCGGLLNSCVPGSICANLPAAPDPLCYRFCRTTDDCVGGPGSICDKNIGGETRVCTTPCDIIAQTCATGLRCEPGSLPGESVRAATDCIPIEGTASGEVGDACSSFRDCTPGLTCAGGSCLSFCRIGDECPGAQPCGELSPAIEIGDVDYGACPP